jgi:hypothetical protein
LIRAFTVIDPSSFHDAASLYDRVRVDATISLNDAELSGV